VSRKARSGPTFSASPRLSPGPLRGPFATQGRPTGTAPALGTAQYLGRLQPSSSRPSGHSTGRPESSSSALPCSHCTYTLVPPSCCSNIARSGNTDRSASEERSSSPTANVVHSTTTSKADQSLKISHTAISDPISMSLKQQLYTFRNTDSTPPLLNNASSPTLLNHPQEQLQKTRILATAISHDKSRNLLH
jgi:hypothetical protein